MTSFAEQPPLPEQSPRLHESLTIMEIAARANIELIETVGPYTAFGSLWFVEPSTGEASMGLEGPCDPINRNMLDSVYSHFGIDVDAPLCVSEKEQSNGRKDSSKTYKTMSGVEIVEREASEGSWHVFKVTYTTPR